MTAAKVATAARERWRSFERFARRWRIPHGLAAIYGFTCIGIGTTLLLDPARHQDSWTFQWLAGGIRLEWFGATMALSGFALILLAVLGLPRISSTLALALCVGHMAFIGWSATDGAAHSEAASANAVAYAALCMFGTFTGWAIMRGGKRQWSH